jgi:hypothetical protein
METPTIPDSIMSPREWAEDVLWAAERIHLKRLDSGKKGRPSKTAPPGISPNRYALWQFGCENQKEMLTNLVPRAFSIQKDLGGRDQNEALIEKETIEIGKMKRLLRAAINESKVLLREMTGE